MAASIMEYLKMPAMGKPDLNNTINELDAPTQIQCAMPETQSASASLTPFLYIILIILVCMLAQLEWQRKGELQAAQQQKEENANVRKINSELTTGIADLKDQGQKKEQEAAKKVAELEKEKAELMAKAQKEQEKAADEIADLMQTNSEMKTNEQSQKRRFQDLTRISSKLTTDMAALMETRQQEQERAAKEIADLKDTISELKTNAQNSESERSNSGKQVTGLQAINSELQADAQKSQSEISELEKQVTSLKKDLEDCEHRVDARDTLLLESNMQLENTRGHLAVAKATIPLLQQRITEREAANQRMQKRNELLADDNAQSIIQLEQRRIKQGELEEEIVKLRATLINIKAALGF